MTKKGSKVNGAQSQGISWKWLAGVVCGVVILLLGSWAVQLQGQITLLSAQVVDGKDKVNDQKVKQATTEQKVDQVDKKVDNLQKDVGDIKSTLQKLLILQEQLEREREKTKK